MFKLDAYRSDFVRNSASLASGTAIAQLLPIVAAPVLARLYQPADYGFLAIYMAVVGIVGLASTLQYSSAIQLPAEEEDAEALVGLSLIVSITLSAASLFLAIGFVLAVVDPFKPPYLALLLLFAPISVFLTGLNATFTAYAGRHKCFALLSQNRILCSVGTVFTSLIVGFVTRDAIGLFAGLWVGQIIGGVYLSYRSIAESKLSIYGLLSRKWGVLARRYSNFPKFTLPAEFINMLSHQIPIFMLGRFLSTAAVGHYSMSNRLLGLPSAVISGAIGEVFRQRAAKDYVAGSCRAIFVKTFLTLLVLGTPPFLVVLFFGPSIFEVVLGNQWKEAGEYAQIMSVMFFFRFVVSPLTCIYHIANRQREDFYLHLMFPALAVPSLYVGLARLNSVVTALSLLSVAYSAIYAVYLIRSYLLASPNAR